MTQSDPRYPFTYAIDCIRSKTGFRLSRSEGSKILQVVADAVGMSEWELAEKLAHAYQNRSPEDMELDVTKLLRSQGLI